jgi:FixJ family two-component response regulator
MNPKAASTPTTIPATRETSIVHIVESSDAVRDRLVVVLEAAGLHVMAFSSPDGFLAAWSPERHGCLLLDIHSPGFDGLDFQADLRAADARLPVILMSERPELPRCVRYLKPGTVDMLIKPIHRDALLARVAVACEKDVARRQSDVMCSRLLARYEELTGREKQVLELVSEGLMNKQIASMLDLSVIMVKVHRGTMMRKMGWRRLVEVVRGADALKINTALSRTTRPDAEVLRY